MKLVENNVVELDVDTGFNADPDAVLKSAMGKLGHVIVIGWTKDGRSAADEYFASSIPGGDTCVWLLQRYIHKLLQHADEPE